MSSKIPRKTARNGELKSNDKKKRSSEETKNNFKKDDQENDEKEKETTSKTIGNVDWEEDKDAIRQYLSEEYPLKTTEKIEEILRKKSVKYLDLSKLDQSNDEFSSLVQKASSSAMKVINSISESIKLDTYQNLESYILSIDLNGNITIKAPRITRPAGTAKSSSSNTFLLFFHCLAFFWITYSISKRICPANYILKVRITIRCSCSHPAIRCL